MPAKKKLLKRGGDGRAKRSSSEQPSPGPQPTLKRPKG
jgi:hypothetical protein